MKKIDKRIPIIIVLTIIFAIMCFFYFKDDTVDFSNFSGFTRNRTSDTTNDDNDTVTLTTTSQIESALTENMYLHATYKFSKLLVSQNQFVKKGTKIVKYTNGKYLKAPYDLVIVGYNIPSKNKTVGNDHYIQISSYNVLKVDFRVDESKMSNITLGKTAKVKIPALNDTEITGYVTNITSTADNGRFTVTVEFDNNGKVKIGMTANITI